MIVVTLEIPEFLDRAVAQIYSTHMRADVALNSVNGGHVRVMFKINTEGKTTEIYLKKSVEFVLDEEALRVIRESPLWIPAFQNGQPLNVYRIQPVTFIKE
jgi:TonB family protein